MIKTFKNHSRDRELDDFEEDLTKGKTLDKKEDKQAEETENKDRGKNENI